MLSWESLLCSACLFVRTKYWFENAGVGLMGVHEHLNVGEVSPRWFRLIGGTFWELLETAMGTHQVGDWFNSEQKSDPKWGSQCTAIVVKSQDPFTTLALSHIQSTTAILINKRRQTIIIQTISTVFSRHRT